MRPRLHRDHFIVSSTSSTRALRRGSTGLIFALPAAAVLTLFPLVKEGWAQGLPAQITVSPSLSTSPVSSDADDCAIWLHPSDPSRTLLIGTDKGSSDGGLFVWNLAGQQVQYVQLGHTNNVDVRYGLSVGGRSVDIAVVNLRDARELKVFAIDPSNGRLTDITTSSGIHTPDLDPYGLCLYRRPGDGAMFVIQSSGAGGGDLHQHRLEDDGSGRVKATLVRTFGGAAIGSVAEGLVADDELGYLYVAEEQFGVHKFHADPIGGNQELAAFATGDGISGDREGLAIYACGGGTGYLLLSSQGNSTVKVYRREGEGGNTNLHRLLTTIVTSGSDNSDGIEVTSRAVGSFGSGFLAKHSSSGRNFALYALTNLGAGGLPLCPGLGPCNATADFRASATSGCGSLAVAFTDQSSGPPTSWAWDFGDGYSSTSQNPSHTYAAPGAYTVKLTIGSGTCSNTATRPAFITIGALPQAGFAGSPASGDAPLSVEFTDQSTGVPASWSWDFGDGASSSERNPVHQYTMPGTYSVSLNVSNGCGADAETKAAFVTVTAASLSLARNRPATASSAHHGSSPGEAVDGSDRSSWRSDKTRDGEFEWLRVDLGAPAPSFDRVVVVWEGPTAGRYLLEVSDTGGDGQGEWRPVSETALVGVAYEVDLAPTRARFLRVVMSDGKKSGFRIAELEVYSHAAIPLTFPALAFDPGEKAVGAARVELQNLPNPFGVSTQVTFRLPREQEVTLKAFDVTGAEVATLADGRRAAGAHTVVFEPRRAPSGVYFLILRTGGERLVRRAVMVRR